MKKIIAIIMICMIFAPIAEAKIGYEIKAGVGAGKYQGVPELESRLASKIGVGIDIPLAKRWSFEPNIYYSTKGTQFTANMKMEYDEYYEILMAKYRHILHYIDVPLYVCYNIPLDTRSHFSLKAGPYVGLGLSGKANIKTPMYNDYNLTYPENLFAEDCEYNGDLWPDFESSISDTHSTKKLSRFDAGLAFSIDVTYRHIILGFECMVGLTRLSDEFLMSKTAHDDFLAGKPKNFSTCFMVGYTF